MDGGMESLSEVLDDFVANINLVTSQLRDEDIKREEKPGFSTDGFWTRIDTAVELLSRGATKLCLAFTRPPFPSAKDCKPLLQGLEESTLALVSIFYSLPKSQGSALLAEVRAVVVSIITSVGLLATIVKHNDPQRSKNHLTSTGTVWEYCEGVRLMPRDNKDVVLRKVKETEELVADALTEIQEALATPGDSSVDEDLDFDEPNWSKEDRELVLPAVNIIKAIKASLKKTRVALVTRGQCDTQQGVKDIDQVAERLAGISSAVDEFVAELYPPISDPDCVKSNANSLVSLSKNLLSHMRESSLTTEVDISWLEFLNHALDHNVNKMAVPVAS